MRNRLLPAGLLILALFTASILILTQPVINQVKEELIQLIKEMYENCRG